MEKKLSLSVLQEQFCICKLDQGEEVPNWVNHSRWVSITKTEDELSIVCQEKIVPNEIRRDAGWRCLKVLGPLDFSLVGILAGISSVLATAGISIFVVSTYETDYIFVKEKSLEQAMEKLIGEGYEVINHPY